MSPLSALRLAVRYGTTMPLQQECTKSCSPQVRHLWVINRVINGTERALIEKSLKGDGDDDDVVVSIAIDKEELRSSPDQVRQH